MIHAAIIDGRAAAARMRATLKDEVAGMTTPPGLAVILVGDNPASHVYVAGKQKACAEIGIKSFVYNMPATSSIEEITATIDALNDNDTVHGILLQMPLPAHLDSDFLLARIAPSKDVDGLNPANLGLLLAGRPHFTPCTPQGVMELLRGVVPVLAGKHAVILGRSVLVGRPMGQLLLGVDCTVTHAHSKTNDLAAVTSSADILICATGQPGLITAMMVKPGAVVIDVGITRTDTGLVGDVDYDSVKTRASAITPVPGGVGPMTVACLMKNTVLAAKSFTA